jgi:opacity protein-like surface antigen
MNTTAKLAVASALALAASSLVTQDAQANDLRDYLTRAPSSNWYLGGSLGYNATSDQTSTGQTATGQGRLVETTFDDGFATGSYIGYRVSETLRLEGELAFRRNDGQSLAFNGNDQSFAGSGAESYSFLANAYYDFPNSSAITPYVGVGAGISFIDNDFLYRAVDFDDNDTSFVYQGIAGLSTPLTPRIDVFLDARYIDATDVKFERVSPADGGVLLDSEYENFTVSVGYRFKL